MRKIKWIRKKSEGKTLTDKVLFAKGIENKELFLNGNISNIHNMSSMNDGLKAIKVIKETLKNNEKIVLMFDFDCDGSSGCAVAFMMLKELGGNVSYYSNNRFAQGYGMCKSGIDEIISLYPDTKLIITIDNGIMSFEGAEYVKSLGIKLIITDHHEQGKKLPIADAVVNPKRADSTYPFDGICGAVVIWKVLRELYKDKDEANKYLDILAIATVGDVVPLIDENRIIVKEGLKLLRKDKRLSLKILREMTNTTNINSHFTLAYLYAPIFNAISRIKGDIDLVVDFLVSEDEKFIRDAVTTLINYNEERKVLTTTQLIKAEEELSIKGVKEVIVLYNEEFHEGIIGLIAGRLKEEYNRPAFVFTKNNDGNIKGSARSITNFNIKESLDECQELLLNYGGHALAGGLSLEFKNLKAFEEKLIKLAQRTLTEDDYIKKFYYIDVLEENEINEELIEELAELEPYGVNFEKPLIKLKDFNINRCFTMGKEKEHIKLMGEDISLIGWRQTENYKKRKTPLKISALGYPELNIYNNNVNIQFIISEDNFY